MTHKQTTMSSKIIPGQWPLWRGGFVILVLGMLVGCSSTPKTERSDLRDPYEHTNRKIFAFNMGVDSYVLEPVADGYRSNVPDAGRRAVERTVGQLRAVRDEQPRPNQRLHPQLPRRQNGSALIRPGRTPRPGIPGTPP